MCFCKIETSFYKNHVEQKKTLNFTCKIANLFNKSLSSLTVWFDTVCLLRLATARITTTVCELRQRSDQQQPAGSRQTRVFCVETQGGRAWRRMAFPGLTNSSDDLFRWVQFRNAKWPAFLSTGGQVNVQVTGIAGIVARNERCCLISFCSG